MSYPLHRLARAALLASAAFFAVTTAVAGPPTAAVKATVHARTATSQRHAEDKDLPNFHIVNPGIYRGAAPTDAGLARLKSMGVRTIIDLRIEKHGQVEETKTAETLGFRRIRIPLGAEAPTKKQVQTFLAVVNDPASQPVFVHCQWGADRTGAMMGIYRVTHDGWTFDQAWAEMRKYGFKPFLGELKGSVKERAKS